MKGLIPLKYGHTTKYAHLFSKPASGGAATTDYIMNKLIKIGWWLPILIVALVIFLLPTKNYWLGDQYSLSSLLEKYNTVEKLQSIEDGAYYISPLSWWCILVVGFKMWSLICGILYLGLVFYISREYGYKWLILLCLPLIQLFCSYVEVYSLSVVLMLLTYIFYKKEKIILTCISAALTILAHVVVGTSVVALIFPLLQKKKGNGFACIVCALLLCPVLYLMFGGFTRENALVPLFGQYSWFSTPHLIDMTFLFLLNFTWLFGIRKCALSWKEGIFPVVGVTIAFLIDSHLGVVRDWDLLSVCLLPASLVLIDKMKQYNWIGAAPAIIITTLFLLFNSTNRTPEMVGIMSASPQYTIHPRAQRNIVVAGVILNNEEHSPVHGQYLKWNWEKFHDNR